MGDVVTLSVHTGPSTVRNGYGPAVLKRILTANGLSGSVGWEVHVQNSNWIDEVINGPSILGSSTGLSRESCGLQSGANCPLEVNSTWTVYARCVSAGTISGADSAYCVIDIDYPDVSSIESPDAIEGTPMSLRTPFQNLTTVARGAVSSASWTVLNVDNLKPGYKYLKSKVGMTLASGNSAEGFVSFANGASMRGLSRIVPISTTSSVMTVPLEYGATETKGPVDYKVLLIQTTSNTGNAELRVDYVKKAI